MKLPNAEEMRSLDDAAINQYGVPGVVLMENAGKGTVDRIVATVGSPEGKLVSIFAGPGNNGGDGFVIARHLHQLGGVPVVFLLADTERISGDAGINYDIVQNLQISVYRVEKEDDLDDAEDLLAQSWLAVDALFGTGLKREVGGLFRHAVQLMNEFPGPVVAVDIPSGIDSDTGQSLGASVAADLTVTFALPKIGHVVHPGAQYTGVLEVVDIGIPPEAVHQKDISRILLEPKTVRTWLPLRRAADHKGTFGHLLILAGSPGKTGAAILAAQGALRSGAGLVTLCSTDSSNQIFETALAEAMTIPVSGNEAGSFSMDDYEDILAATEGKTALALGPGLGTSPETVELVKTLYREVEIPMLVDADGLNALSTGEKLYKQAAGPRILTPHPGEMAGMCGKTSKDVQKDRLNMAETFAKDNEAVVLLKGAGTIVSAPDGRTAVNPTGNQGMAAGGMGDVLSGLIGGLLAQGVTPWEAACLGAFCHGRAGDLLAEKSGIEMGYTASGLADEIPGVFNELNRAE